MNGVNGMGISAQDQLDEDMIRNIIQFIKNMLRMTVFLKIFYNRKLYFNISH